jgi:hypothetical protein
MEEVEKRKFRKRIICPHRRLYRSGLYLLYIDKGLEFEIDYTLIWRCKIQSTKRYEINLCTLLKSHTISLHYHQMSSRKSVYFSNYAKMNSAKHVKYRGRHSRVPVS